MKAEVLVNLAKEAGLKVEDLMLIRHHKDEFEKFKRMLKDKPVPNAKPVGTAAQGSHTHWSHRSWAQSPSLSHPHPRLRRLPLMMLLLFLRMTSRKPWQTSSAPMPLNQPPRPQISLNTRESPMAGTRPARLHNRTTAEKLAN